MSSKEHVHTLMSEIGPLLNLAEVIEYNKDNFWILTLDDETLVEVDYSDDFKRIVLSVEIGAPPEVKRYGIYEFVLQYNYLWRDTGGARLALDGPAGKVVYLFELPTTDLDINRLSTTLENLFEHLKTWKKIINCGVDEINQQKNASNVPETEPNFFTGAIKV
jgi:hypothetical protein